MNTKNSTNVVWIDTNMHRCTAMEEDTAYPIEARQSPRIPRIHKRVRLSPMQRAISAAVGAMVAYAVIVWVASQVS